jgi:cytidine deaminase
VSADIPALMTAARGAQAHAYAPYSDYAVGAALLFDDGAVITGSNVENASYGLSLCAETMAVARAMNEGRRGGLVAVAVVGPGEALITPCGRCRQVLNELAALGGTDPAIHCARGEGSTSFTLSQLLPEAFGPG